MQPYATLPVGRAPIGAGDWGAGLVVPISYDLSDTVSACRRRPRSTPRWTRTATAGTLAYGGTLGLGLSLSDALGAALEVQAMRDEDPGRAQHAGLGGAVAGVISRRRHLQLDVGSNVGLNHDTPRSSSCTRACRKRF